MRPFRFTALLCTCLLLLATACALQPTAAPVAAPVDTPAPAPSLTLPPAPSVTPTPATGTCLVGDWQISPETVQSLLVYLTEVSSLQVMDGALYLKFNGTSFAYHANGLALRSSFMDSFLDAKADILIEGSYQVRDDTLRFTQLNAENQLYDWMVVKGDYVRPFTGTSPVVPFEIVDMGSFSCDDNSLRLMLSDQGEEIAIDLVRAD